MWRSETVEKQPLNVKNEDQKQQKMDQNNFFKFDKCEVKYSWYAPLVYELQFLIRQCVDPRYGKVLAYKVPEQYTL